MRTDETIGGLVSGWEGDSGTSFMGAMRRPRGGMQSVGAAFSGGERNRLFLSREAKQFSNLSGISGLNTPADGRAFVVWDYNRDGWQDVALVNANQPLLQLYRNDIGWDGAKNRRRPGGVIAIRLKGGNRTAESDMGFSNRDGIGALVTVALPNGECRLRELRCGEGMASQNSATLLVALGGAEQADSVSVAWPSGKTSVAENIAPGVLLTVFERPSDGPDESGFAAEPYTIAQSDSGPVGGAPVLLEENLPAFPAPSMIAGKPPSLRLYTTMETWCVACKRESPFLKRLREVFSDDELSLYGIPTDPEDDESRLNNYIRAHAPVYEILIGLPKPVIEAAMQVVLSELKAEALPASFVTDEMGRVLWIRAGVPTVSDIQKLLDGIARAE